MIKKKTEFGYQLFQYGCPYPCGVILNRDPYDVKWIDWGDTSKPVYGPDKVSTENKLIYNKEEK